MHQDSAARCGFMNNSANSKHNLLAAVICAEFVILLRRDDGFPCMITAIKNSEETRALAKPGFAVKLR